MEFDFQILKLTKKFYRDYPKNKYPELLEKNSRAYNCLLLETNYDYFLCIPFRSSMKHSNGYKFQYSARSKRCQSGLDYSKIVIVVDPQYLSNSHPIIDGDEYNETAVHIRKISKSAGQYVSSYIKIIKNRSKIPLRYKFSTLKYFHKELGITT